MSAKKILNVLKAYIMVYINTKFRDSNLSNQKLRQGKILRPTPLIQKGGPKSPRRIKLLKLVSLINLKRISVKRVEIFASKQEKKP